MNKNHVLSDANHKWVTAWTWFTSWRPSFANDLLRSWITFTLSFESALTEKVTNQFLKWCRSLRSLKRFIHLNDMFATDTTLVISNSSVISFSNYVIYIKQHFYSNVFCLNSLKPSILLLLNHVMNWWHRIFFLIHCLWGHSQHLLLGLQDYKPLVALRDRFKNNCLWSCTGSANLYKRYIPIPLHRQVDVNDIWNLVLTTTAFPVPRKKNLKLFPHFQLRDQTCYYILLMRHMEIYRLDVFQQNHPKRKRVWVNEGCVSNNA